MTLAIAVMLVPVPASGQGLFGEVPDLWADGDIFGASLLTNADAGFPVFSDTNTFGPVPDVWQPGVFGEVPQLDVPGVFGEVPNVLDGFTIGGEQEAISFEQSNEMLFGEIPNLWTADIFGPIPNLWGESSFTSFTFIDW